MHYMIHNSFLSVQTRYDSWKIKLSFFSWMLPKVIPTKNLIAVRLINKIFVCFSALSLDQDALA